MLEPIYFVKYYFSFSESLYRIPFATSGLGIKNLRAETLTFVLPDNPSSIRTVTLQPSTVAVIFSSDFSIFVPD